MSCFRIKISQTTNNMIHLENIYISLHNFTLIFSMRLIPISSKYFLSSLKDGNLYTRLSDSASTSIMLKIIKQNNIYFLRFIAFSIINILIIMNFTTTIFKIIKFNNNIIMDISFLNATNFNIC